MGKHSDFLSGLFIGITIGAILLGTLGAWSIQATRILPYKDGQVCVVEGRERVVECFTEAIK